MWFTRLGTLKLFITSTRTVPHGQFYEKEGWQYFMELPYLQLGQ